ncbi:MAG TPA: alpha amylase N-terminal ig-like domain-containing protein [Fimbriimonas sp.]|nr:alpha amylase N-terminal ig-like domain-containing protein [Fimbriimonas sp.]
MIFFLQAPDTRDYEFVFKSADAGVRRVVVAGTFNNWDRNATPMKLESDGMTWTAHAKLPLGKIQYKFVVDGDKWLLDPSAASISDGSGNTNSLVLVVPADYSRPASPSDGSTATSVLRHRPSVPDLNYDHGRLRFILRTRPNDLSEVDLKVNGRPVKMAPAGEDEIFESYQAYVPWNRKEDLTYDFQLHDGSKTSYFGAGGFTQDDASPFKLIAKEYKPFEVPSWVEKSVVYQIFPDRFADGDKSNDPPDVQPWDGQPTYSNRFGGDAAGVKDHLDYLKRLGVGAVYFTPVFKSPSNHRYDTTDYRQIDPQFGTNEEFCDLTKAMKADGIRTVMDFAFNHTATDFWAFKDIREKGRASEYKDWYFIKSYPVVVRNDPPYVGWAGYPSMPKLNTTNPATHRYVLDTVDFWKKDAGIAGVRLDVANEVDPQMWKDLRTHLKGYAPDTWIVGEEWGDASPWLGGDQWDATMGYQFRDACLRFFAEGSTSPTQFTNRLMSVYSSYAPQVARNLMNLLGSHDTPRFLTLCHDDKDLLKLAATVEFTWPGAPTIYYGDELGMKGGKDPDNRRGMEWSLDKPDNDLLRYYEKLIKTRNEMPVLQSGDPALLYTNDGDRTFAYSRSLGKDWVIVAVNASEKTRTVSLQLPSGFDYRSGLIDALSGGQYKLAGRNLSISLPPMRAVVLVPEVRSLSSSKPADAKSAVRICYPDTEVHISAKEPN